MKVKEVKERLDSLERIHDNAIKIQECCLRNKEAEKTVSDLEEFSAISMPLRYFASYVAEFTANERKRISMLIDNADVQVD